MEQSVITDGLWLCGTGKCTFNYSFWHRRWQSNSFRSEHPDASPIDIESSKGFVKCLAFGIEGSFGDPNAALSTIVQYYKDFAGGWQ